MRNLENALLRRFSGARIIAGSLVLGLCGFMPLQVYIWFGPADGNPIGLGLLALATLPFAAAGIVIGSIKMLVRRFRAGGG